MGRLFRYIIRLPFKLRLVEKQAFPLQTDGVSVVIRFFTPPDKEEKVFENTLVLIDSTKSIEVEANWARLAFLRINEIIRAYQIVTKDIYNNGIIRALTWDQFMPNMMTMEFDEKGKLKGEPTTLLCSIGIGAGPIGDAEYKEVRQLAESQVLMSRRALDEILVQAKIFLEQHNYRMAILESVIALEFSLSSLLRNTGRDRGESGKETEQIMLELGTARILKTLPERVTYEMPPKANIDACLKANRIRNDIVHRACLTVDGIDAERAVQAVESFINHFRPCL